MSKVYLIDSQYAKSNFPSLSTFDDKDILSTIWLEQFTIIRKDITKDLYDELIAKVIEPTVDETWLEFIEVVQFYLLMLTVRGVWSFYKSEDDENKREYNISNMKGKIEMAQKDVKDFIADNDMTPLGDTYSTDTQSGSSIYYPR